MLLCPVIGAAYPLLAASASRARPRSVLPIFSAAGRRCRSKPNPRQAIRLRVGREGMAEMAAAALRERFRSGATRPYAWRIQQIRGIIRMLTECENELIEAVCKDTGKPVEEMRISEVTQTLCAAQLIEKQLASWMPDQCFSQWGILFPSTPTLRHEPYGVILMIAPFNFPLMLVLKPLLGAVAAGVLAGLASWCVCVNRRVRRLSCHYLQRLEITRSESFI